MLNKILHLTISTPGRTRPSLFPGKLLIVGLTRIIRIDVIRFCHDTKGRRVDRKGSIRGE
jgi:hypothetical protein